MNNRIRDLAHEAGLLTYNPEGIPTKLEKFAELIVRECADVTHGLIVEDGKEFPVKSVAYRLKKHFGVEG